MQKTQKHQSPSSLQKSIKLDHKLTMYPTLQARCSSHLWYLYPLRKASFSCLCESCSSCPLQQAAGSSDQRLQPLYSCLTEDTAPFSPIEPLSAPGELISCIDELHSTNHRRHTDPHKECSTLKQSLLCHCVIPTLTIMILHLILTMTVNREQKKTLQKYNHQTTRWAMC